MNKGKEVVGHNLLHQVSGRIRFVSVVALVTLSVVVGIFVFRYSSPGLLPLLKQAAIALRNGEVEAAVGKARQAVAVDPTSIDGWQLLAQAGLAANDRSTFENAVEVIEDLNPGRAAQLWIEIGSKQMQRLHATSAEHALRQAIRVVPDRSEPWRLLVQLVAIQGRPMDTAECLLQLIRLNSFTIHDLLTLAWPNASLPDPERIAAMLEAEPDNRIPMLSQVAMALNQNRTADAEHLLGEILTAHPNNRRAAALLGLVLAKRDADEFLTWQRDYSKAGEGDPECWVGRGIWLRNHGQFAASARCLHHAAVLDPRHLTAVSELGQVLTAMGERDLAASFLEWSRQQQEIVELARSIEEQNDLSMIPKLVDRLEAVGRLWEAWAWCRIYNDGHPGEDLLRRKQSALRAQLTPSLPRTVASVMPGGDFEWLKLPEPNWGLPHQPSTQTADQATSTIAFVDDADSLGIRFHFENGQPDKGTIVQTGGGGVAAVDYDLDGWCDLYFVQGGSHPGQLKQDVTDALFRNVRGSTFQQTTDKAGINEDGFSQGVSVGDLNNDGFPDLFVGNVGTNCIFINNGDGTFSDVTATSGMDGTGWTTSCGIADFNGDQHPDLFVVRYAGGPDITTRVCRDAQGRPGVCRPTLFPAETDLLGLSGGDGTFTELCDEAGLNLPDGRGFGLVIADFDSDNQLDVFVANDQTANHLLIQQEAESSQVRFTDHAVMAGVAFDRDGMPQACMGVAADDINHDGVPDLFVTNFANESNTLYQSQGHGGFMDVSRQSELRDPGFAQLGFGTQFLDADLDGRSDLVVLNGHIQSQFDDGQAQAMLPQFFHALSNGRFAEGLNDQPESFFDTKRIGRGLCVLDWNNDGLPDFAASFLDGNAALVSNRSSGVGDWFVLELTGTSSSRDAIGTRVKLTLADGRHRFWQATAGDGFASSNQCRMHIGLGDKTQIAEIEIRWPSGRTQTFDSPAVNSVWNATEGRAALLAQ